jgi:hypothetical protein
MEDASRLWTRLAIGTLVTLGIIVAVWIMGILGDRLGFAPLIGVPDLALDAAGALATGTLIVISVPRVIFQAGLAEPLWLMVGFVLIALPAAGLSAAKPATPGGPRMKQELLAIASAGAVCAMLTGILLIWWSSSPFRADLLSPLPREAAQARQWFAGVQTAAGLDALAVMAAALWVVLVLRLPILLWLRAIAASAAFFTLAIVLVAMSISGAAAAQIGSARAVASIPDAAAGEARIILGATRHQQATLTVRNGIAHVELRSLPESMEVQGRQSIVEFLAQEAHVQ